MIGRPVPALGALSSPRSCSARRSGAAALRARVRAIRVAFPNGMAVTLTERSGSPPRSPTSSFASIRGWGQYKEYLWRCGPTDRLLADPAARLVRASGLGRVGRWTRARDAQGIRYPRMLTARNASVSWLSPRSQGRDIWFTVHSDAWSGGSARRRAGARGFAVSEISWRAGPQADGIAADGRGGIWVAELAPTLVRIGTDGQIPHPFAASPGSRPRGVARPDGRLVTLLRCHQLLQLDLRRSARAPGHAFRAGLEPYAIASPPRDGVGRRVHGRQDRPLRSPRSDDCRRLPRALAGAAIAVDGQGRVWYAGSASGRLGVVE